MSGRGLIELFVSIDEFLSRSPEIIEFLEPLDPSIGAVAAQAYFCPEDGRALAVLLFHRWRQPSLHALAETFGEVGLECFELEALPAHERDHFQRIEPSRYTIRIEAADTLATALIELLRRASADALYPKTTEEEWPGGTPAEVKAPLAFRRKPATTELDEALDTAFPPIDEDEPTIDSDRSEARSKIARPETPAVPEPAAPVVVPGAPLSIEAPPEPEREHVLRIRYLRGERWLPGKVRYISNREVRVATCAPPRRDDVAVMAVSFAGEEVFVTGTVTSVEGLEGTDKSPGFTASLGKLSGDKKLRLVGMLTRARDAGVSLQPPPVRRARRYPVSWPVVANISGRPERATALDISWTGLYLDIQAPVGAEVLFALPLDVEAGAIRGRGRVVRAVDSVQATELQTSPGIGVAITHLGPGDDDRYRAFLARVSMRCRRRVIVGAAPIRAQGLSRALAAAGYAVTSSTDASALVEIAGREVRPPDIAVIDDSLGNGARPTLLSMFRSRNVPTLAIDDEQSDNARRAVDHILSVKLPDDRD